MRAALQTTTRDKRFLEVKGGNVLIKNKNKRELRLREPRPASHNGIKVLLKVTTKSRPKERDRQMYIYQSMTGHMDAYHRLSFPGPHYASCSSSLTTGFSLVTGLELVKVSADYGYCVLPPCLLIRLAQCGDASPAVLVVHADYGSDPFNLGCKMGSSPSWSLPNTM